MQKATSKAVINFLRKRIFHTYGTPEIIHSDNGRQFISQEFQDFLINYNIKHMRTAAYSPQSNASERVNQTVLAGIRASLNSDHREWDSQITEIECAIRSAVQQSIGTSPYMVLFGQQMFTSGCDYALARKLKSLAPMILKSWEKKTSFN